MTRTNRSPSAGSTIVNTLRPYEGGTGQTTAAAARTALNLVAAADINQPNGVAGLGADGKIQATQMPDNGPAPFGVQGPATVTIGSSTNFTITNYDIFTTYTLTAISGTVDRNGDTISYTAPSVGGAGGFVLNGRQVNITVQTVQPNAPSLTVVDVASGLSNAAFNCTGSAFSMNTGSNTHASSDWQIASDAAFTTVVSQSLNDATNKTSWTSGALALSTTYYTRVRYRDSAGNVSGYSNVVTTTTKSGYVIGTEESKLTATTPSGNARFGSAVAMDSSGTRVAVGAPNEGAGGTGAVYVFIRSGTTWSLEQRIQGSDLTSAGSFGVSLAMDSGGSKIAVGAPLAPGINTSTGAGYVFTRNGSVWSQSAKVFPNETNGNNDDQFGSTCGMSSSGGRYAFGSPVLGATYIYSGSSLEVKLLASDSVPLVGSIAFDGGSRIAVGTALTSGNIGAVYVFAFGSGWAQEQKITAGASGDFFGCSLSFSSDGSRLAIGSYAATVTIRGGAVYVFGRSGTVWSQEAKFTGSDTVASNQFGRSVSMSADGASLIAGAPNATPTGFSAAGKAYTFQRTNTTWSQQTIITASDKAANDNYGNSVSIASSGIRAIVGCALSNPSSTTDAGAAYVYR